MSPDKIETTSSTSVEEKSSLEALDYSLRLLRQLRDVLISASEEGGGNRKVNFYCHRAILEKDPFFAALFKDKVAKEYHLEHEHPDVLRRRIERAYSTTENVLVEKEETVVLRAKKNNHVNGEGLEKRTPKHKAGCSISLTCCFSSPQADLNSIKTSSPERSTSATSLESAVHPKTFAFERNNLSTTEFPFNIAMELDKKLINKFETISDDQKPHCHFTYLLLDPVLSDNFGSANSLAVQILTAFFKFSKLTRDNYYRIAIEQVNSELFSKFLTSIFYIGTGEGSQMGKLPEIENGKKSKRAARIRRANASGKGGPVPVYVFTDLNQEEAEARKWLMMEAIGTGHLVNDYDEKWQNKFILDEESNTKENQIVLGTYLLLKSFLHFVANGQRKSPVASQVTSSSSPNQQQEFLNQIIHFK